MSEHMRVKGKVDYIHLPYENLMYCQHCKKNMRSVEIFFHEGAIDEWIQIICLKCKKTTWTSKLDKKRENLDKQCHTCRKKTSYFNSYCMVYNGHGNYYFCSKKCEKTWREKNEN